MHHIFMLLFLIAIIVVVFVSWGSIDAFFTSHLTSNSGNMTNAFSAQNSSGGNVFSEFINWIRAKL